MSNFCHPEFQGVYHYGRHFLWFKSINEKYYFHFYIFFKFTKKSFFKFFTKLYLWKPNLALACFLLPINSHKYSIHLLTLSHCRTIVLKWFFIHFLFLFIHLIGLFYNYFVMYVNYEIIGLFLVVYGIFSCPVPSHAWIHDYCKGIIIVTVCDEVYYSTISHTSYWKNNNIEIPQRTKLIGLFEYTLNN